MPTRFAARKWPSSWTNTSTPSTNANESGICSHCGSRSSSAIAKAEGVTNAATSDLQFYRARDLERILTGPLVNLAHGCKRRHLFRPMRRHRGFDDVRNRHEAEASVEKARDGNLVRGIQHDGQTARGLERAIRESKTRERFAIGHFEVEASRAREIERGQRRRPAIGIRERILNRQPHV